MTLPYSSDHSMTNRQATSIRKKGTHETRRPLAALAAVELARAAWIWKAR